MPDAHKAPRNQVVSVRKTGLRGAVRWIHELDCGHHVSRDRKSKSQSMGCVACLDDWRNAAEWIAFGGEGLDAQTTFESDAELTGVARISLALGVAQEMVQPVYSQRAGSEFLTGFTVWVPADAVNNLG